MREGLTKCVVSSQTYLISPQTVQLARDDRSSALAVLPITKTDDGDGGGGGGAAV